jgi:FixJ family two-component response regulator
VKNKRSLISVIDDDVSIRESLPDLLDVFGFAAQTFSRQRSSLHPIESVRPDV